MEIGLLLILGICLLIVLLFEFVNGMNDTANAVAPVIYSHSLSPNKSVLIAAFFNFIGVLFGGIAVAMSIIHLLPLSVILSQPMTFGIAVIVTLLISAIIWDIGAWYLALPVSSSHALIGSILGVSMMMMWFPPLGSEVLVHWGKAQEVILGLLVSPIIGFGVAFFLIYLAHKYIHKNSVFRTPRSELDHPTLGMRSLLVGVSALVSFMHGKNDGQKGVGIATLILIVLLPGHFALNPAITLHTIDADIVAIKQAVEAADVTDITPENRQEFVQIQSKVQILEDLSQKDHLSSEEKIIFHTSILDIQESYKILKSEEKFVFIAPTYAGELRSLDSIEKNIANLSQVVDYVPWWIIVLISISIGAGTMIGWKRIVKTIGEKIGKYKMNYSQAAASSLVTAGTIGVASSFGLPVSTTHVMSSSVAGTMVEEHGWKDGIDMHTIRHILLAWVLTMPVTIMISGLLFYLIQQYL